MTPGEFILLAYALGTAGLLVVAIAFACSLTSSVSEPALRVSLDCLSGVHGGCPICEGCSCHAAVAR